MTMIDSTRPCYVLRLLSGRAEGVRRLSGSEVQSSKRNCCGGQRRVRPWLEGGVNEAGTARFEAFEAEPAAVPLLCPAD